MKYKDFFWLHIKKSAGITTRKLLQPYYLEVDRTQTPSNFLQSSPEEYNDILNNYRVVLGEYQLKRSLFAQKVLYPQEWDKIFSFAFSREPVERCLSMFYYLYWPKGGMSRFFKNIVKQTFATRKIHYNTSYAFDLFLENIKRAHSKNTSIYSPLGLHFTTHTAPMWEDITDYDGNILLKRIYRLENLYEGLNKVFKICGYNKRLGEDDTCRMNKNSNKGRYKPNKKQLIAIEDIYLKDFEIYENSSLI